MTYDVVGARTGLATLAAREAGAVGGLFYHNCPGGAGLMAGSVFGKAAGESAAADLGLTGK